MKGNELLKTVIAILLILVGFHLLLYGWLRRRIAAAKLEQENRPGNDRADERNDDD